MSNKFDKVCKYQARKIYSKSRKENDGKTSNAPEIIRLIHHAAETEAWDRDPADNTIRGWVRKWDIQVKDFPREPIVCPGDDHWGPESKKISTLNILFNLACEIWEKERFVDPRMESKFPGFPWSVCDWAWQLSPYFDLTDKLDRLVLLENAYDFSADEKYDISYGDSLFGNSELATRLVRWKRRVWEVHFGASKPIFELGNEGDKERIIASKLKGEPLIYSTKDLFVFGIGIDKDIFRRGLI